MSEYNIVEDLRRTNAENERLREALERVKGLVPEWRERGRNKPEFEGGYYFILADELEAATADPKPLMTGKHPKEFGRDTVALADQQEPT